jgi:hypothetical protein
VLVKLSKREIGRVCQSLRLAIEYQESKIDAHTTTVRRGGTLVSQTVSGQAAFVRRWRRDIAAFQRLIKDLKAALQPIDGA